jgi:two-component system sensor histidine kinase PilS (NtrC family)
MIRTAASVTQNGGSRPDVTSVVPDDALKGVIARKRVGAQGLQRRSIIRWVYLPRIGLAGGIFAGAVIAWSEATPAQTLTATLVLVLALTLTPISYWFSHVRKEPPGTVFVYAQSLIDIVLVTMVVHLTGSSESVIAPVYILLISAYTLMLPLRGGFLVAALTCVAYIGDVILWQGTAANMVVALQLVIFVSVSLVVGLISTKLKEAGAELTTVEYALEQLRLDTGDILGNIPTAVLTIDGSGRLAYANPAAERLIGIKAATWLDRPVMDELGNRSVGLQRALDRTRSHHIPVASVEIEILRNGERIPVGISTALLERREGPPSVTAIMRDISDRKRMEHLRQRTERLEAIAELSASLAHEIKNPLSSISSSVQQLKIRKDADDDDRLLANLVLKESDRLSRLLSDFIDFARVRIKKSRELDLRDIVGHALELVRQHPSYRPEIELDAKLHSEPVVLTGDEDLLHRVVSNLALNAVQAAVPGCATRVEVEVRPGWAECPPGELDFMEGVLLKVTDTGPGIDQDDLKRIFDPFFSKRHGGTGLGLAIVHRAIQEHHGTILVSSSDKGTQFTICLPTGKHAAAEAVAEG